MNFARVLVGTDNVSASLSTADFLALSLMFLGSSLCYCIDIANFPLEWTRRRFFHPTKRSGKQEEPKEEEFMQSETENSVGDRGNGNGGSVNPAAAAFSKRPAFAPVYSSRAIAAADYDDLEAEEDGSGGGVGRHSEKLRGYGQGGGGMMHASSTAGRSFGGMREPEESQSPAQRRLTESAENSESDAAAAAAEANRSGCCSAARRARWWPLRAETYCELLSLVAALLNIAACAMPYMIANMDPSKGVNLDSVPLSIAVVDLTSQSIWLLSALGGAWVWHRDRIQVAKEKWERVQRGLAVRAAQQSQAQGEQFLEESTMPTRKSNRSALLSASSSQLGQPVFKASSVRCSWISLQSLGWWMIAANITGCLLYMAASIYGLNTSVVVLKQTKIKQYKDAPTAPTNPAVAAAARVAEGAWAYIYSGASYARYQLLHGSFGVGLASLGGDPHPPSPNRPPKLVPQWSVSPQTVQTLVHQQRILNLAGDCVFLCCALFCELEYSYETYKEMGANRQAGSAGAAAAAGSRMRREQAASSSAVSGPKSKSPSAVRRMPVSAAHPRHTNGAGTSALHAQLLADAADHGGAAGSEGGPFSAGYTPYDSADSSMSNSYRFTTAFVGPASVASHVGTMPGSDSGARQHWRKPSDAAAAAVEASGRTASYSRASAPQS